MELLTVHQDGHPSPARIPRGPVTSSEKRSDPSTEHPSFTFLLQASGAEERRRTLTPLALRYSILSESTQGRNLLVMLWAHSLSKEAESEITHLALLNL